MLDLCIVLVPRHFSDGQITQYMYLLVTMFNVENFLALIV